MRKKQFFKRLTIPSIGKGVGHGNIIIAGENVKWDRHFGKSFGFFL